MTTRRIRGAPGALAMLTLLALLLVTPAAHAADPDTPSGSADGWRKVVGYARCAFMVFVATTPGGFGAAFFECARLYMDEPPVPGGGK